MSIRTIRDLLGQHPFFADLPPEDLDLVAGCGSTARFGAGERIFTEGEQADTFYVIRDGRIALETHTAQQPAIVVATLGEGEVVGWSWLFPPYRWNFDARAVEDTAAVELDGACLRGKCEQDTDLGFRLMQRFARIAQQRLHAARLQLLDLYGTPGEVGRAL